MVVSLAGAWAARSKITSVEERILNITLILIADRRIRPLAEIYTDQRLDRAVENAKVVFANNQTPTKRDASAPAVVRCVAALVALTTAEETANNLLTPNNIKTSSKIVLVLDVPAVVAVATAVVITPYLPTNPHTNGLIRWLTISTISIDPSSGR